MPLSLLLTQQFAVLTEGVRKLARWEALTDTFALVARRLRTAFLVNWFGTGLPVAGLDLRVVVTNLDELQARWALVTRGQRDDARSLGPNLTEPLLGAGGALAGALAFPLNGMVLAVILGSVLRRWWQRLMAGLIWVSGGGLLTAILLAGVPLAAIGLLAYAISGQFSDLYDLLGAVAALALPLQRIWAQLSGQEPIRNPLLRQLSILADRLAGLLAQLLGAVAVAVTRIAPQLRPAVTAAQATMAAAGQIAEALGLVLGGTLDLLAGLVHGPHSLPAIARGVVAALLALLDRLGRLVPPTLQKMLDIAMDRSDLSLRAMGRYIIDAARFVRRVIVDHPTVRWLRSLIGIVRVVQAWNARRPPAPPPPPASPPSKWARTFPWPASTARLGRYLSTTPSAPELFLAAPPLLGADFFDLVATGMRSGLVPSPPDPFALDPAGRAALERFRRPPSVLGGLRADLAERRRRQEAAGQLFTLADVLAGVTPYLTRAAEGLVPAQLQKYLPELGALLDRIDLTLHGRRPAAQRRLHPTRDLPEPTEVRPVVGRLVVRTEAGSQAERPIREFVTALRQQLDLRSYPADAAAAGAGTRAGAAARAGAGRSRR